MTDTLKAKHLEIVRDLEAAVEEGLIHENYRHHDPALPDDFVNAMNSAKAYAAGAEAFRRSFPDLRSEPVWCLEDGDMTACRWIMTGTFTGEPFMGQKPNGNRFSTEGMSFYRWENGRVVEGMTLFDAAGFDRQLGTGPQATGT